MKWALIEVKHGVGGVQQRLQLPWPAADGQERNVEMTQRSARTRFTSVPSPKPELPSGPRFTSSLIWAFPSRGTVDLHRRSRKCCSECIYKSSRTDFGSTFISHDGNHAAAGR